MAGKIEKKAAETTEEKKQSERSQGPAEPERQVTEINRAGSSEFAGPVRKPLGAIRNGREKVDPKTSERAPKELIEEIGIDFSKKKEFTGFLSNEGVYKEVPVLGATAQSSSTNRSDSIGSSTRIVITV